MIVLGVAILIVFVVVFLSRVEKAADDYRIEQSPRKTVTVKVKSVNWDTDPEYPPEIYATFMEKDGCIYTAKNISRQQYKELLPLLGKWGTLTMQGNRFIAFSCSETQSTADCERYYH